jgi:hypothetical protein
VAGQTRRLGAAASKVVVVPQTKVVVVEATKLGWSNDQLGSGGLERFKNFGGSGH